MSSALCPILVERDDELAILEEALLASRRGEGRFVVVAGEAGIGKTRLVSEVAQAGRRLGAEVLSGACSEAELSLPYLPLVEAIGNHLAGRDLEALAASLGPSRAPLAQLFPQLSAGEQAEERSDSGQAKLRLFEAIFTLIDQAAGAKGLVLVIEDVHWADDSTRELLDYLARRIVNVAALVLVTYRSDELNRRHPLVPTLQAWRRSGIAELVELKPLDTAGMAKMTGAILESADVDAEVSALLAERAEGNPFVLEEMLREAYDHAEGGGSPTPRDLHRVGIPATVRDAILRRLTRLAPEHVAILEAAAVLGRSFDYATLLELGAAGDEATQSAIAGAVNGQLLGEDAQRPGRYSWRHALTEEAIYTDIVTPRRQALHSRAADVLAGEEATRPVDLARHLLGAARFADAVPVCLDAAAEAEQAIAFGEAIALLERALPHVDDPPARARLIARIGSDHALNGASLPAERFLADGVRLLEELGEPLDAARYRLVHGRCLWEMEDPQGARAEYVAARETLEAAGPSADLALAHLRLAGLDAFELDYEGCLEHSRRAVDIAEQADTNFERVWALGFVALGLLDSGERDRGLVLMDECYAEAVEKGYWQIATNMTFNDVWTRTHTLEGELEERVARVAEQPATPANQAAMEILGSYVSLARGDLEEARTAAERAIEIYDGLGSTKMAWRCRVHLAEALAELGRADEAGDVLPATSSRSELQDIVYDIGARVRSSVGRGDVKEAAALAAEVVQHAELLAVYRESLSIAAEVLVAAGDVDAAAALAKRAEAHTNGPGDTFAEEIRGRVLLARGDAEAAAELLVDPIAVAEHGRFRLVAMRRRILRAEALGRAGQAEEAERELRAVALAADARRAALVRAEADAVAARLGIDLPPPTSEAATGDIEEPGLERGERFVTAMFADVRGYTELTAGSAPAELEEQMRALYRFARAAVARNGGIVDKFAGDAVMATFNVSGTRVDHCLAALESALALRDKASLVDLEIGIGIAVGPAVVGTGASAENLAVHGEATNLAARLQTAARGGEILLSAEAQRRVEGWLRDRGFEPDREELDLKGFDGPQPAYRLAAPAPARA